MDINASMTWVWCLGATIWVFAVIGLVHVLMELFRWFRRRMDRLWYVLAIVLGLATGFLIMGCGAKHQPRLKSQSYHYRVSRS